MFEKHTHTQETDRKDLLLRGEREAGYLRGHEKKLRKGRCLKKHTKKFSFPHRSIDTWNGLKEQIVMATSDQQL